MDFCSICTTFAAELIIITLLEKMKLKLFMTICAVALGMSVQAKEYKYVTVPGDMMKTRIYREHLDTTMKIQTLNIQQLMK